MNHITPDDFALIAGGWLVVDGEHTSLGCAIAKHDRCRVAPTMLTALVGSDELLTVATKCDHRGSAIRSTVYGDPDWSKNRTVCTRCHLFNGTRSTLVRLTGPAVPIRMSGTAGSLTDDVIVVGFDPSNAGALFRNGKVEQIIDLSPDPQRHIGRWAFPVEVRS